MGFSNIKLTPSTIIHDRRIQLILFLWIVTLHSFFVGLGMIFLPIAIVNYFGFSIEQWHFFLVQGGVFHIVMSIAYFFGAKQVDYSSDFIIFAIIAKFIATIFLVIYSIFIAAIPLIILSGLGDFTMGLILLILLRRYLNQLT